MHWTDTATVLSLRKYGENSAVTRIFSHSHGVYAGVVRAVHSKAVRGVIQPGNVITATWQARLPEQLGTFKAELREARAALIMAQADKLAALASACAVMESALPERHPYPFLYQVFEAFLGELQDDGDWFPSYARLELRLLAEAGFGLDLTRCAATGTVEDLIYVSPKSGRAVSRRAGEPYKDKLLPLPSFLLTSPLMGEVAKRSAVGGGESPPLPNPPPQGGREYMEETLAGLRLTGYFLEHWLLTPHNRKLPAARGRLLHMMKESHAAETA